MGFIKQTAGVIRQIFRQDKERAGTDLAKGTSVPTTLPGGLLAAFGNDYVSEYLKLDSDLIARYADYEEMDEYPPISVGLDVYANESCQTDSNTNHTVWVTSKDENVKMVLNDLFHRTLRLDEELSEICRSVNKYGNDFEEILVDENGVRGLNYLPTPTIRRIESPYGELFGFIQDFNGRTGFTHDQFREALSRRMRDIPESSLADEQVTALEDWEVVHFRHFGKVRRCLYGHSILESSRWIFKRLILMEDSALLFRIQRAPERFAFYIDTGDLPPQEALAYLNKIRQQHKKERFVDPGTGKLNLRWQPAPVVAETPIPLLDGRIISIEEMTKEFESGKKLWVYSVDPETKEFKPGEVSWVGKTRTDSETVRVWFGDEYADMAPDHPVMWRTGEYVLAKDLREGDSVMPFYRKSSEHKLSGYELIYNPGPKNYRYTHRMVANNVGMPFGDGLLIHHADFNKLNNAPENLKSMTVSEHTQLHLRAGHIGGQKLKEKLDSDPQFRKKFSADRRKNVVKQNNDPEFRSKIIAGIRKFHRQNGTPKQFDKYNNSQLHELHDAIRSDAMRQVWADPTRRDELTKKLTIQYPPELIESIRVYIINNPNCGAEDIVRAINSGEIKNLTIGHPRHRGCSRVHRHLLLKLYRKEGFSNFMEFKEETLAKFNHKVTKIEVIKNTDLYCMTVEVWHNFALCLRDTDGGVLKNSGIFVKNTFDSDYYVPVRKGAEAARIEVLGTPQWQSTQDLDYFRDMLFMAIKIPRAYLAQDSDASKASLSSIDVNFAHNVLKIQKELKTGLRKIARVHLAALGIDPFDTEYDIWMTPPSAIFQLAQLEVKNAQADLMNRLQPFVSQYWMLSKIMGLSDDEINEIMIQRGEDQSREAINMSKAQVAGQDAMPQPPPGVSPDGQPTVPPPTPPGMESKSRLIGPNGLPITRNHAINEKQLFAGNKENEKRAEEKLEKLLRSDRALAKKMHDLQGFLFELKDSIKQRG